MEAVKIWGPPGTGKTTELIKLVEKAIAGGYHPAQICFTSFTNAAAREARDRAMARFDLDADDFPYFRTEHSICFRLLELSRDQVFTNQQLINFSRRWPQYQFTWDESRDIKELEIRLPDAMLRHDGDYYEFFVGWMRNMMLPLEEAYRVFVRRNTDLPYGFTMAQLKLYIERRTRYKNDHALWDFSDMLTGAVQQELRPPVKVLIADELQDSSPLLMEVIKLWGRGCDRVYYAGDPYQAIFQFQGAAPELFFKLPGELETLKQSYRLNNQVKDYAQKILQSVHLELPELWPSGRQGEIKRMPIQNIDWDNLGDTFVLARTRFVLNQIKAMLMEAGIPFVAERGSNPLTTSRSRAFYALAKLATGQKAGSSELKEIIKYTTKPYLLHGAKAKVKRSTPGYYNMDNLKQFGFADKFFDEITTAFYNILCVDFEQDDKTYLYRLWNRYGASPFEKEPEIVLTTIHGSKGREKSTVILAPDVSRKVMDSYGMDRVPETLVSYVGVTRVIDRLILLYPQGGVNFPYPSINGGE